MRLLSILTAFGVLPVAASATTLQKLSMDDMIRQSTGIVRAKVTGSRSAFRGPDIYTYYDLQIVESLKSSGVQTLEIAVPGGVDRGLRQTVAGAPQLTPGAEYVMFLWTSRSGLTQMIGLSQGLFLALQNAAGQVVLVRPAITDLILDKAGRVVSDSGVTIGLTDLKTRIHQLLGAGK